MELQKPVNSCSLWLRTAPIWIFLSCNKVQKTTLFYASFKSNEFLIIESNEANVGPALGGDVADQS